MQLSIFMDADGMLEGTNQDEIIQLEGTLKVGALEHGMQSGKPAICFGFTLPDGRTVLAQTSMRLFHATAKAFAARFGWQDEVDYAVVDGVERSG